MRNIKDYESFCLNESEGLFFQRHNMSNKYEDRTKDYGVSENPSVLSKVGNFFERMEDRWSRTAAYGSQLAKSARAERGGGPNTGYETLFGLATVVPGVLKRIFGPTKYEFTRKNTSDDKIDLDLMRHTNEDYVRNELPSIRTEDQLVSHIDDMYKRGNISPRQYPVVDDIARNRVNLYYEREYNPNSQVLNQHFGGGTNNNQTVGQSGYNPGLTNNYM